MEHLLHLLEDWRSLTLTETNLIRSGDWQRLEELQAQKAHLQTLITDAEATLSNSKALSKEEKSSGKAHLREVASELVALEVQNRTLLSELLSQTDAQLKEANRTISSLRSVQNTYGKASQSFWQAYS